MEERNLEKALELAAALIRGEQVGASGDNVALYEEYSPNSQVYDALRLILKKFNLELYEYNNALFVSANEDNRGEGASGFGFTNEELRRELGVRVNKELFLCYLIIYCTMTEFYKTSGSYTYTEFVRREEIIKAVDNVAAELGDEGRILVRESGTEPVIRVMVEAATDELCAKYVAQVVDVMKAEGLAVE